MGKPVFVENPNVGIVDLFTFQCKHCGETFNPEDSKVNCPHCDTPLFERMRKKEFTLLFIDCMSAIGIPRNDQVRFINKGDVPFKQLGICTEMSVAVDLNFQIKFGGQYESFFIKECFNEIKANNFDNEKRRN